MSIAVSMANALSGLSAAARSAEVVSTNVANAMTEGYGRREVVLSANAGGVKVVGVDRISDPTIRGDRREAQAGQSNSQTKADSLLRIEQEIGLPDEPGSLSSAIADFDLSLIEAASQPNAQARLDAVLNAAQGVAQKFNAISDRIQSERELADQAINLAVGQINSSLEKVEELNAQIYKLDVLGRDTNSLVDERQLVIDSIAELIPVQEVAREGGRVALFTPTGGILLDGPAGEMGFSSVGLITPSMTVASGGLSGLEFNGQPVPTGSSFSPIAGGKLAALFEIRDQIAPDAQAGLDALARNLIERFEDPTMDTTLLAGDPGLFTDEGAALDITAETGLADRIAVNTAVDPDAGGEVWRLRDGLNAIALGSAGDNRLLTAMSGVLSENAAPASGPFMGVARPTAGLIGDFLSFVSADRQSQETSASYDSARAETLLQQELEGGVDTDQEMQKLLLIEQAYAANARVVQTIDELLEALLRI